MIHVTRMFESCHVFEWRMWGFWMSHVTLCHVLNVACEAYGWVMSRVYLSRVTRLNAACEAYRWVMSRVCSSRVTHLYVACEAYGWVMSHAYIWVVSRIDAASEAYGWVMSRTWTDHVARMQCSVLQCVGVWQCITSQSASRHSTSRVTEWVWCIALMSRESTKHGTCINESCRVTQLTETCHTYVTFINSTCHSCAWVKSHTWSRYGTHMNK